MNKFRFSPWRQSWALPRLGLIAVSFACTCSLASPAGASQGFPFMAQAVPAHDLSSGPGPDPQARRDQQRKDLRQALKAPQGKGEDTAVQVPVNRHLSPQERAEMRQQLRQQRTDSERNKP